jgi:hypothetical protein
LRRRGLALLAALLRRRRCRRALSCALLYRGISRRTRRRGTKASDLTSPERLQL